MPFNSEIKINMAKQMEDKFKDYENSKVPNFLMSILKI
jgi:hypothetical protein